MSEYEQDQLFFQNVVLKCVLSVIESKVKNIFHQKVGESDITKMYNLVKKYCDLSDYNFSYVCGYYVSAKKGQVLITDGAGGFTFVYDLQDVY